jgi:hypothetical protein
MRGPWPCVLPTGQLAGAPCSCAAARSRQVLLLVSVVGERLAGKMGTSSSITSSGDALLIPCWSSRSPVPVVSNPLCESPCIALVTLPCMPC